MAVKIRDATATLRTLALKMRDAGSTQRTIVGAKMRDASNTQRTIFAAGGGGTSIWVNPPSTDTASAAQASHLADFTIGFSGGLAPTSYAWGVLDGPGFVYSGINAQTARLMVSDDGSGSIANFYCDVTISGTVYRAFCQMTHLYVGDTGRGGRVLA
jgi:hypothetical protein